MPDSPLLLDFPHCPIPCLLPLHDRTERVFRILQNYFKRIRRGDSKSDVRFKHGPSLEGRNAVPCGVFFYWWRSSEQNSRRRFSSIPSGRKRERDSPASPRPEGGSC